MIIWIIFAAITGIVTAVLLHPLSTPGRAVAPENGAGQIYRDQIAELLRERADGRISVEEYELARAETARRLFRESDAEDRKSRPSSRGKVKLAIAAFLSLASISLYVAVGSPDLPSLPLQERLAHPGQDLAILIRKTEVHLEKAPDDGRGWDVIAPIYLRTDRAADAAQAYDNAIRLQGSSTDRLNGLTEALLATSNGTVTDAVKSVLERALEIDPQNPRARFYSALGLEQAGRSEDARMAFEAVAKDSPAGAPWLPLVNDHVVKNGGKSVTPTAGIPLGPTEAQAVAASALGADDQSKMVRGMLTGLEEKLARNPVNFQGWLQLITSYGVIRDKSRAEDALERALGIFPADSDEGSKLIAAARRFDVERKTGQ
ncbi:MULTISPECIES: c-type cytochrome biogenesis protein CcmI [unclassified Rhizobium]|uniref:c-type cytochrome biogenesis protein CcmI n=1 Tax=unclassified Rhizobium TaxID=2613769 RepID=UPI001ADA0D8E|nr:MULTISPECIES: c-type cytochrome biogenesis protein CcmI [unclassified Rhizobium]MBO9127014.1 c-type cytochrome biogenesis protein CcmI [Rhizobium sp. 16-488-2b]MBO9177461.1 c-type cytochrome biogenesis protein CcmI [Rhizobium sp. 16-488-2a]